MKRHQKAVLKAMDSVIKTQAAASASYWKPQYHISPPAFWTNDPNGFVQYQGEYHLFYQHNPFSPVGGDIPWGHVKSGDLVNWSHLPIALAPSEEYDRDGCFSGSAIEKDGKLYLMYTGNEWTGSNYDTDLKQAQCLAVSGDGGVTFEKIADNPVIAEAPEGDIHPHHFRDPKVWKRGDTYYCILGSRTLDQVGQVLLYRSDDLIRWEFINVIAGRDNKLGFMWECPDLFPLYQHDVLVFSPQGVKPKGYLYHNLHQSGYLIGKMDYEQGKFDHGEFGLLDYGFDFYAPQTLVDDQGRRIMIAWMAMWESEMPEQSDRWAGAMTLPRELKMKDGKLISLPVQELQALRLNEIAMENVPVSGELSLEGIVGDCLELEVCIAAQSASSFGIQFRCDQAGHEATVLTYDKAEGLLTLDRNHKVNGPGGIRQVPVELQDGELNLRLFIDRSSVEIFIQNGEKAMTARIYPQETSTGIIFFADKSALLKKMKCWKLNSGVEPTHA